MPGEKGSEVLCGGEMICSRRVKAEFLEEHSSWVGKGRAGAGNKGESAGGVTQTTGDEFSCRLGKDEQ